MLHSVGVAGGVFNAGEVVHIDEKTAKSWILAGLAEQDKSLDGPAEVKEDDSKADNTSKRRADNARRSKNIPQN